MVAAAYRHNPTPGTPPTDPDGGRLNVLLTDHGQRWARQVPALLEPQGVRAFRAESMDQAVGLIEATPIHVAVVDLAMGGEGDQPAPAPDRVPDGLKLLRVIQRIATRPPAVVVVRGRSFQPRFDKFVLTEAMKLNAFSVLDTPVHLEQMLSVLQRALERFYGGQWPTDPNNPNA